VLRARRAHASDAARGRKSMSATTKGNELIGCKAHNL